MTYIKISVCIPTYEMHGEAKKFLTKNFEVLKKQTYKNFEVIISDNSEDNVIEELCKDPAYRYLNIQYFRNPRKGISKNTNEAIKKANGELIKILYMDDVLANEYSLEDIANNFKGHWLVTACAHDTGNGELQNPHFPSYHEKIYLGKNTIGAPSVLTIKNENPLLFDENLTWLLDCDYYKKMYDKYGEPEILNNIGVIIGLNKNQATKRTKLIVKLKEKWLMHKRYNKNMLLKFLKIW